MAARNSTPIDQTFNRLTVLSDAPKHTGNNNRRIFARCDCGVVKDYVLSEVRHGKTRSCGCIQKEGPTNIKHGHAGKRKFTAEYHSWASMLTRCRNPKSTYFQHYGARGIKVCDRWLVFENFLADMGPRLDGMTLDRWPDKNGNYEAGNCRWATKIDQSNNMRSNTAIEYNGQSMTIAQWAEQEGLAYNTLIARIHRLKWPIEKALKTPPRRW